MVEKASERSDYIKKNNLGDVKCTESNLKQKQKKSMVLKKNRDYADRR